MDNIGWLWTIPGGADFSTFCHSLFHHRSTAEGELCTCPLTTVIRRYVTRIAELHQRNYTGVDNPGDNLAPPVPLPRCRDRAPVHSGSDV